MSAADQRLPPDEQLRRAECAREPIHVPQAIQSHGALIAADVDELRITHVSANIDMLLRRSPRDLLGRRLDELFDGPTVAFARQAQEAEVSFLGPAWPATAESYDLLAHRHAGHAILELEPSLHVAHSDLLARLSSVNFELAGKAQEDELLTRTAVLVRSMTGYDRVMIYRFHPDQHGEVVADAHAEGMDDYRGLHYPASDIPDQARRLFLLNASRTIMDSSVAASPILGHESPAPRLDLTYAELRAVSPHHLTFMRNMGQAATLSFSMTHNSELIGLITCAHRRPRRLPYEVRRALEMLSLHVTQQLAAIRETTRLTRQLETQRIRATLVQQMSLEDQPIDGLVRGQVSLLDLVAADGLTVSFAGDVRSLGKVPPGQDANRVSARLRRAGGDDMFVSEALAEDYLDLAQLLPETAGIIFAPLGSGTDYLIWYRREVSQSVNWLGRQTADNRDTPLSPRNSFESWAQCVAGRAIGWDAVALDEVAELRKDLKDVLLRRVQARLAHQGLHDDLTGLANRRQAFDWLTLNLRRGRPGASVAVVFIDVDRVKVINDTFGHAIGDEVIVATSQRLRALARSDDLVARLGGDEFMVALADLSVEELSNIARRIVEGFRRPVLVNDLVVPVAVSVGVAITEADGATRPQDLLREADTAMYLAKSRGGNQFAVFEPSQRPQLMERLDTEQALGYCLERSELELYYQPIVRTRDSTVVGGEALLRWNRRDGGLCTPGVFIPILEETGLIIPVGSWVMSEAFSQLAAWYGSGVDHGAFSLSINLSARQFSDPTLVGTIGRLLEQHRLPPSGVTLEITESAAMSNFAGVVEAVTELAKLGVGLSIDDFGTGYSSLARLQALPVTQLKVDRQFVAALSTGRPENSLTATVIKLAHDFGLTCVAEGVETPAQHSRLVELGCDFAQGFLLGEPLSATEFSDRYLPVRSGR